MDTQHDRTITQQEVQALLGARDIQIYLLERKVAQLEAQLQSEKKVQTVK